MLLHSYLLILTIFSQLLYLFHNRLGKKQFEGWHSPTAYTLENTALGYTFLRWGACFFGHLRTSLGSNWSQLAQIDCWLSQLTYLQMAASAVNNSFNQ